MTARHSPLFTLESGQSGLGIYTSQRDAAGAWGRIYPGIELLVGLGILLQPQVAAALQLVGGVALLLGVMGMMSVGKAVFIDHLALNCACVGGNSKTPLGVVSFAENLLMAGMGFVMLFGMRM
jgi:hypothetical protein